MGCSFSSQCIAGSNGFGNVPLGDIRPQDIYKYVDKRAPKREQDGDKIYSGKVAARKEVALLSHAFTKAVEWGYIDRHPFKGQVRLAGEKPRTRYVEDWEIVECLSLPSARKRGSVKAIHAYIRLKLLTGMSRGDLLRLTMSQLKDDGIHITRHKTANKTEHRTIYEWTEELRRAVDDAKGVRPVHISPYLFCNKKGEGYLSEDTVRANGWNSMWQRFMDRVLSETKVKDRFTEHDLRAKCASDASTLEHARALLSHADSRITERVYRRKPERVRPLR